MKSFKNIPSASLVCFVVIATLSSFAMAIDPNANSCWHYMVGAHATQNGPTDSNTHPCSGKQYCYIARIAKNKDAQNLHATLDQFVGGCADPNHPILSHLSMDKLPACSKETHLGKDQVCVCNVDNCNKKVGIY